MQLRVKSIELVNFKALKKLSLFSNPDFNIIIGENGAGKSTIFEALHLWEKCYQTFVKKDRKSFYQVKSTSSRYVNYNDVDFLRITKDKDLFFSPDSKKSADITLTLYDKNNPDTSWSLGFNIVSPTSIENAFYRVQPLDAKQFSLFSSAMYEENIHLDEAIFIYHTRPVSGVHQFEPYFNEAQIKKKIKMGLSHEVLRNKIISRRSSISNLGQSVSQVLEKNIKFNLPAQSRKDKDEYIKLSVSIDNSRNYDLHLQGSGFLQVSEILSTVEFIDAPLKLLLVDEPDSHIHSKLQENLINHLRNIEHNQFFVISHNDQFVINANDEEVFYLSDESKNSGTLSPVPRKSFNAIKTALGGVILSLEQLNKADNVVFVEGRDDAEYIKHLVKKAVSISAYNSKLEKFKFFPLRGKDNILQKIEYNKRTLSELFHDKQWLTLFDRDFTTNDIDNELKDKICRKMGPNSLAYSHDGYCIESVLFSDTDLLKRLLQKKCESVNPDLFSDNLDAVLTEMSNGIENVNSEIYNTLRSSFVGQKNNRPELLDMDFDQVVRNWFDGDHLILQRIMTKDRIADFVLSLEEKNGYSLFLRSSNDKEEISSGLFKIIVDAMQEPNEIYPSYIELLTTAGFIENR